MPVEADAKGIRRIPCSGIPFGGGPDQGAAATGLREVHQRVLPWRIPVPGVRTGAARGTCVSGHGELSSALHRNSLHQGRREGRGRSKEVSAYGEFTTVMSEERYLVEGLTAMGYKVEVHANGAALGGYHGDERRETAHVIIRRAQLDSASNDIGFVRGK